ncbi:hypothetical protein [Legionella micdadei]|nr:hypothetical protein [Legionella micdadei]CEG60662.1 conserved protein of unknown function [Legionella micdadei]
MAFIPLVLVACSTQDEQYYRTHPQALQEAIKNCPAEQPSRLKCEELAGIATSVNKLAFQLQANPQAFGKKILSLQETLATQQATLKANPNQPELRETVKKTEESLAECLAIVRWLESPES